MQILGQGFVGGQPLVQSDEEHQVVREADSPEENRWLLPPHRGSQERSDEVAHDGEMRRRIGHFRETPLPAREPLPVDFELEHEDGRHEDAPHRGVNALRNGGRASERQKHASDPGCEEEVHSHRVVIFPPDGLEVVHYFQEVRNEDERQCQKCHAPEYHVDPDGDVEKLHFFDLRQILP